MLDAVTRYVKSMARSLTLVLYLFFMKRMQSITPSMDWPPTSRNPVIPQTTLSVSTHHTQSLCVIAWDVCLKSEWKKRRGLVLWIKENNWSFPIQHLDLDVSVRWLQIIGNNHCRFLLKLGTCLIDNLASNVKLISCTQSCVLLWTVHTKHLGSSSAQDG